MTVTIASSGTTATASFSGTAGQRVALYISGSTISSMKISLVRRRTAPGLHCLRDKDGEVRGYEHAAGQRHVQVVVDPARTYTGHVTLTLYNVPADASGAVTVGGAGATVTTTIPGQDAYSPSPACPATASRSG